MKLSTKSEYGLRAMVDLAFHYNQGPVAVSDISNREGISVPYLEQILNRLRRHGLIKSLRGPKGGYVLAKIPSKIKIGKIVEILEGSLLPVRCTLGKQKRMCEKIDNCIAKLVWDKLNTSIEEVLNSVTLSDVLEEAKELGIDKRLKREYMFHI